MARQPITSTILFNFIFAFRTKLTDYNKSVEMDWEKKEKENPQTELF